MANPFTEPSISGYNSSPPSDDGSQVSANQVKWATIKDKLADPIKSYADAMNTAITAAFELVLGAGVTSTKSTSYTVVSDDRGKTVPCNGTFTVSLLAAATAGAGFALCIKNIGSGTVTIDGNSSETIDGAATISLDAQYESVVLICDGSNWHVMASKDIADTGLPRGYLSGLTLSNNGTDADHDLDIAAGECRGADDDEDISLSAITKRIDASWTAGTNGGGLSSSLSLSNSTWYHVHAIKVSGAADVGFDTSVTAANLVTDHGATAYRRIGSVLTDGSANIIAFVQDGDFFQWKDPPLDVSAADPGTSAVSRTLTVPNGVRVQAHVNALVEGASNSLLYLSDLSVNDEAASQTAAPLASGGTSITDGLGVGGQMRAWTNTSKQVRSRLSVSAAAVTLYIATTGWMDTRGR